MIGNSLFVAHMSPHKKSLLDEWPILRNSLSKADGSTAWCGSVRMALLYHYSRR